MWQVSWRGREAKIVKLGSNSKMRPNVKKPKVPLQGPLKSEPRREREYTVKKRTAGEEMLGD